MKRLAWSLLAFALLFLFARPILGQLPPPNPVVVNGAVLDSVLSAVGRALGLSGSLGRAALPAARVDTVLVVDTVFVPVPVPPDTVRPPQPPPPPADTIVPPPPPTGDGIVFAPVWTAVGATNAQRLAGGWDGAPSSNPSVLDVVDGAPLGMGANVLRVTQRSADFYGFIEERNQIPQGVDYYVALDIRVGGPQGCNTQATNHSVKADYLSIQHVFWALHNPSGAACTYVPFLNITRTNGARGGTPGGPSAQSQFHGPVLQQQAWYHFEFHVDVLGSDRRFVTDVRIYDAAGTLIADADDYRQDSGRTLRQWVAEGNYSLADSFDQLRRLAIGYEGTAGSQDRGESWYYANVVVRTDTWPGPTR